jgi:hypothetical protein
MLKPLRNGIFFVFEDEVVRGEFLEKTTFDFVLKNDANTTTKRARWGTVIAIGHEVIGDIQVGSKILIEPLKWTESLRYNDQTFWKTDSDHVLAIRTSEE